MKYLEFYNYFRSFPVFSHAEIQKVSGGLSNLQLVRWQKAGYIRPVMRGFYTFADFQTRFTLNEQFLIQAANQIRQPSYVSLEMALSWYNLIPEGVYLITSVTTKNTANIESPFGHFSFRHLKKELMFGYDLLQYQGYTYKIATMEKALLDYFYFKPKVQTKEDFEGLRLNVPELTENLSEKKLKEYLSVFSQKKLDKTINNLLEYIKKY